VNFNKLCLFGDARAEKFGNLTKRKFDCKELKKEKQESGNVAKSAEGLSYA
jgi:hypothetical protein